MMHRVYCQTVFGVAVALGVAGCAARSEPGPPLRQTVQAVELTDDEELPRPPGSEVAPVVPAEEIPGGVEEPEPPARAEGEATEQEPAAAEETGAQAATEPAGSAP